ncbi:MAG: VCBS repeat-containing protein [Chitinophagaceae bacterium]
MIRSIIAAILLLLFIAACTSGKKKTGFHFNSLPASETGISFENTITESDTLNLLVHEYAYMGGGVGIGDFDNDGLPDIFFSANQQSSRLYHNKGNMQFDDITQKAGVQTNGWCAGVSVVDINQDGWQDVYVCVSGQVPAERRKNLLFINQHDLTFKEEAAEYNLADTSFSTQAAFFDYDKDGDLDMYLLNFLLKGDRNTVRSRVVNGKSWMADVLYSNDGIPAGLDHPVYTNVTTEAGIFDNAYGLGLAISDLNGDSYPDIYTANDYLSNDQLWLNNKNGTFSNVISTALRHQSYSSMGTDIADYNNDGLTDIATLDMQPETNERKKMMYSFFTDVRYKLETDAGYEPQFIRNMLHLNNGVRNVQSRNEPFFSEVGQIAGISETDWSWSVLMADFDNDGWKDMHITNGMGRDILNADFVQYRKNPAFKPTETDYISQQRNLVKKLDELGSAPLQDYFYRNKGDLTFEDISVAAGIPGNTISNGAAWADLDNDGDLDLVVNTVNTKSLILKNELNTTESHSSTNHFITLKLAGDAANKDGLGTKVMVHTGADKLFFEQYPVRGFLSSMDQRIHIGFQKQPDSIVITWPDNKQQVLVKPVMDTAFVVNKKEAALRGSIADTVSLLLSDVSAAVQLPYQHSESFFYDYGFQTLLPQKFSQEGPFISTGDVNGDGMEDFFIGGAYNQSGKIFLQQSNGAFSSKDLEKGEKNEEDMQSLLLDADGDKDPDIFIVSGSSEFDVSSPFYRPRLYLNDGKGNFTSDSTAIPATIASAAKCIAGADIDSDGDTDIFIGGRVLVGNYPQVPRSYLLRNDHGKFTDITPALLQYPGLLNAAAWADIDGDKIPELVLAGEWMSIRIYKNTTTGFSEITGSSGTNEFSGFWRSLAVTDIDNDGDIDIVAGNLGLNNPYRITQQQPAKLVALDFDGNGVTEPIFCYYIRDNNLIYRQSVGITRDQWAMQCPSIKKKFDMHQSFASAAMDQIITADEMKRANVLTCNEVRSGYFENNGKGVFTFHPFELAAQFAPVNSILITDVDNDGIKDILLAGNEYEYNVAVGRMDASYGLLMKGNGKSFSPMAPLRSGWICNGDVRDLKMIQDKKWGRMMLVARNNDSLQVLRFN